jgi:hypothetical protein
VREDEAMEERRKRERITVHFDVEVVIGEEAVKVQTINMSLTGVLCTTHPHFQKDASCKVIISLNDGQSVTIPSKILRIGPQGTAISFTEMDEESFVHLMWCSTMRVTHAVPRDISEAKPLSGNEPKGFPLEGKSLMLQAFGIPSNNP